MEKVKALSDITELFVEASPTERKTRMTGQRRKTPEVLDKMIQFIWDYQQKNNGETPKMHTIGANCGSTASGSYYMINMLVDSGRLNRISSHPFRATITGHADNVKAIERYQRILKVKEAAEADERERIRAAQAAQAQTEQVEADKAVVNDLAIAERPEPAPLPSVAFTPKAEPVVEKPTSSKLEEVFQWNKEAREVLRNTNREIKAHMPQLIKIAETRDLLNELIDRGYVVSKR